MVRKVAELVDEKPFERNLATKCQRQKQLLCFHPFIHLWTQKPKHTLTHSHTAIIKNKQTCESSGRTTKTSVVFIKTERYK